MVEHISEYEQQRLQRIEQNKRKMIELGLEEIPPSRRVTKKQCLARKKLLPVVTTEPRRSTRAVGMPHSPIRDGRPKVNDNDDHVKSMPRKQNSKGKPKIKVRRHGSNLRVALPMSEDDLAEHEKVWVYRLWGRWGRPGLWVHECGEPR